MKYLNYAALCPTRPEVEQEVEQTLAVFKELLYSEAGIQWYLQKIDGCRKKVAAFLNVEHSDSIAFVPNASTANHLALSCMTWNPGDGILTSSHENPSIHRELRTLETRGICVHTITPTSPQDILAAIENVTATHHIRAMIFSHVSHVDGRIFPISDIAKIAAHKNIVLLIDGAQAVGQIPVDLGACDFDVYFFTGHKWCQGPLGTGVLIMNQRFVEHNSKFKNECLHEGKPPATRCEIGTHNIGLIAGLAHACELNGNEKFRAQERETIRKMVSRQLVHQRDIHIKEWDGPHAQGILSFQSLRHSTLFDSMQNQWDVVAKQFTTYPEGEIPAIRLSWLGNPDMPHVLFTLQHIEQWMN